MSNSVYFAKYLGYESSYNRHIKLYFERGIFIVNMINVSTMILDSYKLQKQIKSLTNDTKPLPSNSKG